MSKKTHRSTKPFRPVLYLLLFVFLLIVSTGIFISFLSGPVSPKATESIKFIIPKGQAVSIIGKRLQEEGLVRHHLVFRFTVQKENLDLGPLGLEEETGSLEPSKAADMIAVDLSGIESEPNYEPISQLVYATGRDRVTDVWVAGKHVLKERELTTIDTQAVLEKTQQWYKKLSD